MALFSTNTHILGWKNIVWLKAWRFCATHLRAHRQFAKQLRYTPALEFMTVMLVLEEFPLTCP